MYGSGSDGSGSKRFHGLHGSDGSGSHGSGSIIISAPPVPVRDGSYSFDGSGASISMFLMVPAVPVPTVPVPMVPVPGGSVSRRFQFRTVPVPDGSLGHKRFRRFRFLRFRFPVHGSIHGLTEITPP